MKYRTRLYLTIGLLFLIVMVASYVIEGVFTRKELAVGQESMRKHVIATQEARRHHTEQYMANTLEDARAKIKTLVYELDSFLPLQESFSDPGAQWVSSATYLVTTLWIDMLQIGPNENLESLIILKDDALDSAQVVQDPTGVVVCHMKGMANIAIPLSSNELLATSVRLPNEDMKSHINYYVLYRPQDLISFDLTKYPFYVYSLTMDPLQPFFSWKPYKIEVQDHSQFIQDMIRAQAILKANPRLAKMISVQAPIRPAPFSSEIQKMLSAYEQQGLIWALSTLSESTPALQPQGIVRVQQGSSIGLMRDSVFFTKPQLNFSTKQIGKFSVYPAPKLDRFFFGETIEIDQGKELTLGISGDTMLEQLARATDETAIFFAGGKLISAYNHEGQREISNDWKDVKLSLLEEKRSGFVEVGDEEYFFLHLHPIKDLDMHFFLFEPKAKAFALVISINEIAKEVVQHISWLTRIVFVASLIVVFVLLHFLAKRVTSRVTLLAEATKEIKQGKYEDAHLPEEKGEKHDEVSQLYQSFREMIKGMIEKEKVRGVLDKVVSTEIAEEILKGEVALGGEERNVTVFFADIRHFTDMTETMQPSDAICLLNECMTHIARIIDSHGGVIDKFVGDEVMALFGAPIDKPMSTLEAVQCGIDVIKDLSAWNEERKAKGLSVIEMGIGIHKGPMIAGNMGSENRLNYTVIGANVNLASRLCGAASPMEMLISESVYDGHQVRETVQVSEEKTLELKGFSEPVKAFAIKIL